MTERVKLTEAQRAMLLASEPSDRNPEDGVGVELWTGADYAVAKALERRGLGDVEGPGQPKGMSGLYFNNSDGLELRRVLLGLPDPDDDTCKACGACWGFIGADCDGDCEHAEVQGG